MPYPYQQEIERCFSGAIGSQGLNTAEFDSVLSDSELALADIRRALKAGDMRFLSVARAEDDLSAIERTAADLRGRFSHLVVLGTGGSSLGARALAALATDGLGVPRVGPRLHFIDNIDPDSFDDLLGSLDLARTGFLVISKSGNTMEIIATAMVCLDLVGKRLGAEAVRRQFVAITEPGDNPLRRIATRAGMPILDHDPKIGGRYSVLSVVGLLTSSAIGLDVRAVRSGAASVLDHALAAPVRDVPPAVGAALAVGLGRHRGASSNVLMAYGNALIPFVLWYCQLWAESLGKGGLGMTPIGALGPVDQHSQLQLYLDGPRDKYLTFVVRAAAGRGAKIAWDGFDDQRVSYLTGRTIGDVVEASQRATAESLAACGRPIRVISLRTIDERALGALFMHFMLETLIAARLLGVDPINQPAVKDGKIRARRYLAEAR